MTTLPDISVIIPTYNENHRIVNTINIVSNYLKKNRLKYEIIIVDDGSTDRTVETVKKLSTKNIKIICNFKNKGKGFSIRKGMIKAKGKLILFSDADLSTPIYELYRFLKFIPEYDIVIGSRAMKASKIKVTKPIFREFIALVFNKMIHFILGLKIKDTQCGFKLFKNKTAKEIFSRVKLNGFCFDVEALYLAKEIGYKVKELPITWYNTFDSKVNPFKESIVMFIDLLSIRFSKFKRKN